MQINTVRHKSGEADYKVNEADINYYNKDNITLI